MCWKPVPWCGATEVTGAPPSKGVSVSTGLQELHMAGSLPASLLCDKGRGPCSTLELCCLTFQQIKLSANKLLCTLPHNCILCYSNTRQTKTAAPQIVYNIKQNSDTDIVEVR